MINSLDAHISKKKGKTERKKRSHLFTYNFPFFSIHSKYDFSLFSHRIAYERKRAGCLFVSFQCKTNVYERASSFCLTQKLTSNGCAVEILSNVTRRYECVPNAYHCNKDIHIHGKLNSPDSLQRFRETHWHQRDVMSHSTSPLKILMIRWSISR